MSVDRKWTIDVSAPPRCGGCTSSGELECYHFPKCPVCGFKLIAPEWCSGCDAVERQTAHLLVEPMRLPAGWAMPSAWDNAA